MVLISSCSSAISHPVSSPDSPEGMVFIAPNGTDKKAVPDHWWLLYRDNHLNELELGAMVLILVLGSSKNRGLHQIAELITSASY